MNSASGVRPAERRSPGSRIPTATCSASPSIKYFVFCILLNRRTPLTRRAERFRNACRGTLIPNCMKHSKGKASILRLPSPRNPTAAYTGLTAATGSDGVTRLYAANFRAGKIDVFDESCKPVRLRDAFSDPHLPAGYAPFNIECVTVAGITRIFVMYAMQDLANIFGLGRGVVNTFDLDGTGHRRFAQYGELNAPWGIATAPAGC